MMVDALLLPLLRAHVNDTEKWIYERLGALMLTAHVHIQDLYNRMRTRIYCGSEFQSLLRNKPVCALALSWTRSAGLFWWIRNIEAQDPERLTCIDPRHTRVIMPVQAPAMQQRLDISFFSSLLSDLDFLAQIPP